MSNGLAEKIIAYLKQRGGEAEFSVEALTVSFSCRSQELLGYLEGMKHKRIIRKLTNGTDPVLYQLNPVFLKIGNNSECLDILKGKKAPILFPEEIKPKKDSVSEDDLDTLMDFHQRSLNILSEARDAKKDKKELDNTRAQILDLSHRISEAEKARDEARRELEEYKNKLANIQAAIAGVR